MFKKLVQKLLGRMGYKLQKLNVPEKIVVRRDPAFSMKEALKRSLNRGTMVETVIDVGASDGRWSKDCMKFYPKANYILIEAQEGHRRSLKDFVSLHENVDFILAAAGPEDGSIYFDDGDLFAGVAATEPLNDSYIQVPVISIDSELSKRKLVGPYLLKLDTHGFEVPILEGAKKTIKGASLVIIETYNYKLTKDSLRYWEMCQYMSELGFQTIENVDLLLRELDQSLWQMDSFFIPNSNIAFSNNNYS